MRLKRSKVQPDLSVKNNLNCRWVKATWFSKKQADPIGSVD